MMRLATSVVLALANFMLAGAVYLLAYMSHPDAAIVIEMVFLPLLLAATLVFVIRDLIRPATRISALVALFLSIPGALLVASITLR